MRRDICLFIMILSCTEPLCVVRAFHPYRPIRVELNPNNITQISILQVTRKGLSHLNDGIEFNKTLLKRKSFTNFFGLIIFAVVHQQLDFFENFFFVG